MTEPSRFARPASVDDLKFLLRALNAHGVDYLLIGGYALYALGYQRGTVDIDLVLPPTREQGERARQALLLLPEGVAKDLDPAWFVTGETIRVADEFVVDLMFNAAGETYESLLPYAVTIDFDGVPVRTLNLEGLLKTKQTVRDKDRLDREVLERALDAIKREGSAQNGGES
jgi:predicted nucleotidyltransferase